MFKVLAIFKLLEWLSYKYRLSLATNYIKIASDCVAVLSFLSSLPLVILISHILNEIK